ncbi:hypothetical protein Nepgr_013121 [Nepenthes gracilis]|uniref:Uncharacterized protein n=1 Tax=Nepenthes gracilis TaxID=150966 RepID=A0AAD3XP33_NEPGR|nr:hypothetical protein Nepgr_013121 [Nepenthes gracilis]
MGCCLSKKDQCSSTSSLPTQLQKPLNDPEKQNNGGIQVVEKRSKIAALVTEKDQGEEKTVAKKKEVFVIQHRKSNDRRPELRGLSDSSDGSVPCTANSHGPSADSGNKAISGGIGSHILANGVGVRTSSCTKEEVDAILIQCGRLSRSSSGKATGRKYSGSKRSHDFENEIVGSDDANRKGFDMGVEICCDDNADDERRRPRQSRGSHGRRTPSRSREREQQQRSGSRERGTISGSGRRVSRSPGRRAESPIVSNGANASNNGGGGGTNGRPGKMVSVPATVSSLSMDKGNNNGDGGDAAGGGNVKRVLVKRNVGEGAGGSRGIASPRSQSPARANHGNGNGRKATNENNNQPPQQQTLQQQPSLSRSSSRKAEQSPHRRTPLTEIDMNSLPFHPLSNSCAKTQQKSKETKEEMLTVKQPSNLSSENKCVDTSSVKVAVQGTHRRTSSKGGEGNETAINKYCRVNEHQTHDVEQLNEHKGNQLETSGHDAAPDTLRFPQTLMRSRSSRLSRDLDINVESLQNQNAPTDYNSLLLQDIQNFHQKNNANTNTHIGTSFTLPPCLSKTCSILEAVADLNSSTGPSLYCAFDNDRQRSPLADLSNAKHSNFSFGGKRRLLETKDPFVVETEVTIGDDLIAPSIHKYVTIGKKVVDEDLQESSGSNSFMGGQQKNRVYSSSREPNSADSTDCWTSRSTTHQGQEEEEQSPVGFERLAYLNQFAELTDKPHRKLSSNVRESSSEHHQSRTAQARPGAGRSGIYNVSSMEAAAAAST